MAQNHITDRTTGVVEIEIDTPGAGRNEGGFDIAALVVDGCVVSEQPTALGNFGWPAGYPDRSAAGNLRDLADRRADCAGRCRYHHGIAGSGKHDVHKPTKDR